MNADKKMEWGKLLAEAITEPGKISDAYRRFHGFSLGNRLWALIQCLSRGITPGPLATFNRWKDLGRTVQKGQKAISLCKPVTCKRKHTDEAGTETEASFQLFVIKNEWFVLAQTEGQDYTPEPLPEWNEAQALEVLNITKVPFASMNGNAQGYAAPDRQISVSPLAVHPFKTLFHELAHITLGHVEALTLSDGEHVERNIMEVEAESVAMLCCASLDLPGVEHSRGYIQSWAEGQPISDKSAQRIFASAEKILKAGTIERQGVSAAQQTGEAEA